VDAGMEGGPDSGLMDAGMDGGSVDSGLPDSGSPDAGIVCGSVTTGSFNGFISLVLNANVGSYTFSYHGIDGMGNALISMSCAEGTFETSYPCPVGIDTVVSRPSDGVMAGRTITIHPSAANVNNSTLTINVTHP
jgi:hypothetical protein